MTPETMTPEFFTIAAGSLSLKVTPFGASAVSLYHQGFDFSLLTELKANFYTRPQAHFGAIAGPIANRIADDNLMLDGKPIHLDHNEGDLCLHGGTRGLGQQYWNVTSHGDDEITFAITQPDGALGLPGHRVFQCQYRLSPEDSGGVLTVKLSMTTDQNTFCNLAFHPYFCLDDSGSILSHCLRLNAIGVLEKDGNNLPTGKMVACPHPMLDFINTTSLSGLADPRSPVLDHYYGLPDQRDHAGVAVLSSALSGLGMVVTTDQPGLQLYAPPTIDESLTTPDGDRFKPFPALCIEAQKWPNAPHHDDFPSIVVTPDQAYQNTTQFQFIPSYGQKY